MTDYCDLLHVLNGVPYRKIRNVEVVGFITRELPSNPKYLGDTKLDGCFLVEVKLFFIKFSLPDPVFSVTNTGNPKQMYFCNGFLSTCISESDRGKIGDWFSIKGNISIPKGSNNIVNLFHFKKGLSGWVIGGSKLEDVDVSQLSTQSRFYSYINLSAERGTVLVPHEVTGLPICFSNEEQSVPTIANSIESLSSSSSLGVLDESVPDLVETKEPETISPPVLESENLSNKVDTNIRETSSSKSKRGFYKDVGYSFDLMPMSKDYDNLHMAMLGGLSNKSEYLDKFSVKYSLDRDKATSYITDLFDRLVKNWKSRSFGGSSGRSIVKIYLDKSGQPVSESYMGSTVERHLLGLCNELFSFALGESSISATRNALRVATALFGDAEVAYAGLVSSILGLDVKLMMEIASFCNELHISFSSLFNQNPYLLLLVNEDLHFQDVEDIAVYLGLANREDLARNKKMGILYDYTLTSADNSTIYNKDDILRLKLGTKVTERKLRSIKMGGSFLVKGKQSDIVTYINPDLKEEDWSYPKLGWVREKGNYILPITRNDIAQAIHDLVGTGLGTLVTIDGVEYLCNNRMLEKELFVYNKLYELSRRYIPIDDGMINSAIHEFEGMNGFTLEKRQRLAVCLARHGCGVVTGPAGGGKTTASKALVYVLTKINPNIKIQFGAPTGKASKRLQEVVNRPVKTMHSMFRVFGNNNNLFDESEDEASHNVDAYIFDENAMVTIDLLYAVLSKIDRAQIFFLGDIDQLPPIGRGLPFRDMLSFLPFVALNVSKRSAEGSNITRNSTAIIDHSESDDWQDLVSEGDCILNECADDAIADYIYDLCAWYLGKSSVKPEGAIDKVFAPDSIQVMSPIGTKSYNWSTTNLNKRLQNLFCPRVDGKYFMFGYNSEIFGEYRIGDRILIKSNTGDVVHYSAWSSRDDEEFLMSPFHGVVNGDVGSIVGLVKGNDCRFIECETDDKDKASLRDDSSWVGDNKYFIVVKLYDTDIQEDYFVLLRCLYDVNSSTDREPVFYGGDLSIIDLAYALTVHKMQGSESKLVIGALGVLRNIDFLTRNLVYTIVTRGKDLVHMVGSVGNNRNSALSVARRKKATSKTNTVMNLLS